MLAEDLKTKLREKVVSFRYYSLAIDESTDVKKTARLTVFIRDVDGHFQVTEELAA